MRVAATSVPYVTNHQIVADAGRVGYAVCVRSRLRSLVRAMAVVLVVAGSYGVVRFKRSELVDFAVPRTAAVRFLAHEPLYRPDDGHYRYKYLPAFALLMVPFTWMSKQVAEVAWFTLTAAMAFAFVRLSLFALPDRRLSSQVLVWLTVLLTGKFFVKELAFGQFNLPVGLLLLGAVIAAQHGRGLTAGAAVAAGVFVKPYTLVLVPWLARTFGWRPFVSFTLVMAAGLILPAVTYGWDGNLTLLREWYRTVTDTTGPNLLGSTTSRSPRCGRSGSGRALWPASCARFGGGRHGGGRRRHVAAPTGGRAELSGGGVLLCSDSACCRRRDGTTCSCSGCPAYMCLVDRWRDLSTAWRAVALTGFFLTSFTIFDLLRAHALHLARGVGATSVGAVLIAACLVRLRWKAVA